MSSLAVAAAFTNVQDAQLAQSALVAAGIDATLADEQIVSLNWAYSNAVGGVKVLVPEDTLEMAREVLKTDAVPLEEPAATADQASDEGRDVCPRCGGEEFESEIPGKRAAILAWLAIGIPLGVPRRLRSCRRCGARVE